MGMELGAALRRMEVAGVIMLLDAKGRITKKLRETRGQGTTEYAILVGVLVVIAILAVIAFKGKLQALWDAITEGINKL